MSGTMQLPDNFNPVTQLLNYTSVEGDSYTTFAELDDYMHRIIQNSIIFGARIGAAGLVSITLFLISKNRKTPVFVLNQTCLLLVVIHSAFYLAYIFGPLPSMALQFTGFYELASRHDLNIYAATNFSQLFLVTAIEASLIFQVRAIFQEPGVKWLGRTMVSISFAAGLAVVGLTLYTTIQSVISILKYESYVSRALDAQPILFASSINLMSFMLIYKLTRAVRSRRYLGLKQFDGFHILLIMSTQSLLIPSILLIVSYAVDELAKIAFVSVCTLLVTISLPLSSMWAASATDGSKPTSTGGSFKYTVSGKGTSYFSEPGTASTKVDATSHRDTFEPEKVPSTPTAEEEEERYWNTSDDYDEESHFVARTTRVINE